MISVEEVWTPPKIVQWIVPIKRFGFRFVGESCRFVPNRVDSLANRVDSSRIVSNRFESLFCIVSSKPGFYPPRWPPSTMGGKEQVVQDNPANSWFRKGNHEFAGLPSSDVRMISRFCLDLMFRYFRRFVSCSGFKLSLIVISAITGFNHITQSQVLLKTIWAKMKTWPKNEEITKN